MYKYKCLNPIAGVGLNNFSDQYVKVDENESADVILVRSAKMHEMEFDSELKAIARAGAGVNNIPLDRCADKGIVVFNTPGANANGVKELFIFAAIAGIRDIVGGIGWTASQKGSETIAEDTEKEKKKFVGNELIGKNLAVIGLGAIGAKVANVAVDLGMNVLGFDAFLNDAMKANLKAEVKIANSLDEVANFAEMISIHVPALDATKGMINKDFLDKCNDGLVLINLARDTLVNLDDLKVALESGKVKKYVCDFPTAQASNLPNTILIPHLGASTEESEDNCAIMAVKEIADFLENGNIKNSVNYPAVDLGKADGKRLCLCYKGISDVTVLTDLLKANNIAVKNMAANTKGDFGYALFDIEGDANIDNLAKEGILKARII